MRSETALHASTPDPLDMRRALDAALRTPIEALRASIESLACEFETTDPRLHVLRGVLDEVRLLDRNVLELVDFSAPAPPRPSPATSEEILASVRHQLTEEERARVVIARERSAESIVVDAPLVSRCLLALVRNALEACPDPLLVRVRHGASHTSFSVINQDLGKGFDVDWALSPCRSGKRNHLGLGLAIALRDVERVGGRLELDRTLLGTARARVLVPNRPAAEQAA